MFARKITVQLKPDSAAAFASKMEREIIPLLRKQAGFQDEVTFTARQGREAFAVSMWDRQESAEAYEQGAYPQVVKMLETLVDGAPRIETYDVCNSTCHRLIASVTP